MHVIYQGRKFTAEQSEDHPGSWTIKYLNATRNIAGSVTARSKTSLLSLLIVQARCMSDTPDRMEPRP